MMIHLQHEDILFYPDKPITKILNFFQLDLNDTHKIHYNFFFQ